MPKDPLIHTKRLSQTRIRELKVYYDKGGMNYWDYSQKPKGVYFSSGLYEHIAGSGIKTWQTGQVGDGYILVVALERFSAKQLRLLSERVLEHSEQIHAMFDQGGQVANLKALLRGKPLTPVAIDAPHPQAEA